MSRLKTSVIAALCVSLIGAAAMAARTGGEFKTIDGPSGGQAVYGQFRDQNSMAGAMGAALRMLHAKFGDRPRISRFFQARGSNTVATFFQLTPNGQANRTIAGLVIVSAPPRVKPAVWIVFDDAGRFRTSAPKLLQALSAASQPNSGSGPTSNDAPGAPHARGAAQPLHRVGFSDGSGSIGLPSGWRLTSSGGGAAQASGPNGEMVAMGALYQGILDPRAPGAQASARFAAMSHSQLLVCAYGQDLVRSFMSIIQQVDARQGRPAPSLRVISQSRTPVSPYESNAVLVLADIDTRDGKGVLTSSLRIGAMKPITPGHWAMTVTQLAVPKQLANAEWSTLEAIAASYNQNGQVIAAQTQRVVAQIQNEGETSRRAAAAQSAENDRYNHAIEANRDSQDRSNQDFSNYLRGQTVVQDNDRSARGTMDYAQADVLVKLQPDRYQYVQSPDFLKGIDY
jgi:hypothetical protein